MLVASSSSSHSMSTPPAACLPLPALAFPAGGAGGRGAEATMGWPPEGRGIITGPDGDLGGVTAARCPDGRDGVGGGGGAAGIAGRPIIVGRRAGGLGGAGGAEAAPGRSSCGTGICRYCSSLADSCSISAVKTFFIHDARSLRE